MMIVNDLNGKLFFINGGYIFHIRSDLSMQTLPASDPFPVAGIAFVPHDELRSTFRFVMSDQCGEHRRDFRMIRFVFISGSGIEKSFFDEARIILSAHEAMTVHHGLVERNVRPHADDAILFQCAAHPQNGLAARFAPHYLAWRSLDRNTA